MFSWFLASTWLFLGALGSSWVPGVAWGRRVDPSRLLQIPAIPGRCLHFTPCFAMLRSGSPLGPFASIANTMHLGFRVSSGAPWDTLGALWCSRGCSWSLLGISPGAPGASLGSPGASPGHSWGSLCTPGGSPGTPRWLPGASLRSPGVSLATPRDSLGTPGDSWDSPGALLGLPRGSLGAPGASSGSPGASPGHPWGSTPASSVPGCWHPAGTATRLIRTSWVPAPSWYGHRLQRELHRECHSVVRIP